MQQDQLSTSPGESGIPRRRSSAKDAAREAARESAREMIAESMGPPGAGAAVPQGGAFGEIEFSGFKQQAKFVRLDSGTAGPAVQQILSKKWDLSRPTLVINIFGGNFEKKRQLRMILKKGLWKAAESAGRDMNKTHGGCWIVTSGFNLGIMKLAGEAVRDYTDAYGANHMIAIGVASWGCVAKRRLLEGAAKSESNAPITYPSEETESSEEQVEDEGDNGLNRGSRPLQPTDEEEASLDSNHTHFFLVESGLAMKKGQEMQFRSSLERAASSWQDEENHDIRVPMCGLLIGGDRFSLKHVFRALTSNQCPIVVVKGTAGAADVVALAIELYFQEETQSQSHGQQHGSDKKEAPTEEEKLLKFQEKMTDICQDYFNCHDYFDYSKEVEMLTVLAKNFVGLIEIFDMEEDFDLDGKMISSLLSSAGSDCGPDQLNLKQLKICLTLNRADIARDKIFLENKKWKKGDLNEFMYQALMDDRHEFVKLLLEQGFSLENFLTIYILEKLYTDQLKRLNSKVAIFNQIWEHYRSHRNVKKVRLKEVGKVIKVLMGDFYQPLYTKKEFDRTLQADQVDKADNSQAKEDDPQAQGNNGGFDNPVMLVDTSLEAAAADAMPVAAVRAKGNKSRWVRLIREQQRESRAKTVTLERPARELLIWSLLVGKLQMAELFWAMEKEPIAAALLSSKILKAMVTRTDDFTDTEDFLQGAQQFEDRAWGVLDQCYREDEARAQFLINRELSFYGDSSCIYLAAEAKSIKFMAHPCCQDFLTSTWMGKLSPKNALSRFSFGILCGLICPLLLPKVMLYKMTDKEALESELLLQQQKKLNSQASITASTDQVTLEMSVQPSSAQANPPLITQDSQASLASRSNRRDSDDPGDPAENESPGKYAQNLQHLTCEQMAKRICDFYMAPVIRFVYNSFSFITFLVLFSYLLLFELDHKIDALECVVTAWVLTLLLEEFKQAFLSGDSLTTYISDSWNKLDVTALTLYIIGFILRMISMVNEDRATVNVGMMTYSVILTDTLFIVGRICYAFSLFAFFIRLMYLFSFHIALGPKLIMIGKMVVNDLIPFMVILLVFILGYGVAAQSIAYPTGLYTPDPSTNVTTPDKMSQIAVFLQFLTRAYFQMFGEFFLDPITAKDDACKNSGQCPHWTAKWLVPIMLGVYVLLTNILMFNLLIAMFTSTYESIHQFSAQHWNYQRYNMIREYLERSPLAPPFIFLWHIYEVAFFIYMRCRGLKRSDLADPLRMSYRKNQKKERELVKWEHMKAMDYLRQGQEAHGRKTRGGDSRSIIVRTGGPQQLLPGAMDVAKQMSDATSGIGMELEKRFKAVDTQLSKLSSDVETKVNELTGQVTALGTIARDLRDAHERLIQRLNDPLAQPISAQDPRLEDRVRAVLLGIYTGDPPPWFLRFVRQAAVEALQETPVAVREVAAAAMERMRAAQAPVESPRERRSRRRRSPTPEAEASSGSNAGDDVDGAAGADPDLAGLRPRVDDPAIGRVAQFRCLEHRLWRFAPFNFERYPGMRMNVPPGVVAWETPNPDYYAFDASDETPAYPSVECYDMPTVALPSITFNQYDASAKLRRQSLLGRYHLDGATGAPLNPMGRTGLKGKGLLPRWGPNCAIIVMLTRWSRSPVGTVNHRLGQPILQVVALVRHRQFCLPWYLTDHLSDCDFDDCVPTLLKTFIGRRLKILAGKKRAKQEVEALQRSKTEQIFKGYIDDHMNADNAWIEAVVVNIHEPDDWRFSDAVLKVFSESDCDEQTKWIEVAYSTALRASHCDLLKTAAGNHSGYF